MVSLKYLNSHLQINVFPFPQYRKSVGIFGKVVKILTRRAWNVWVSCHDWCYTSLPSTAYAGADSNKIATVALRDLLHGFTCIQNTTRFNGMLVNVILYTPIRNIRLPVFSLSRNYNQISYLISQIAKWVRKFGMETYSRPQVHYDFYCADFHKT